MDSHSTVFSAKVMAILKCIELLWPRNFMRRRINICSDSRVALAALKKTTTESSLVWECIQMMGKVSELNKVILLWLPGHQGIPGNEEADRLANEGAIKIPPKQFTAIPFSVGKKNASSSSWN
jgi:ribonuclease HI